VTELPTIADLSELRRIWDERRARAVELMRRIDFRGMTRPARSPEERAWLEARGGSPFIEDEAAGELARAYYRRKYGSE
jgi:hypothetical protein